MKLTSSCQRPSRTRDSMLNTSIVVFRIQNDTEDSKYRKMLVPVGEPNESIFARIFEQVESVPVKSAGNLNYSVPQHAESTPSPFLYCTCRLLTTSICSTSCLLHCEVCNKPYSSTSTSFQFEVTSCTKARTFHKAKSQLTLCSEVSKFDSLSEAKNDLTEAARLKFRYCWPPSLQ